MQHIPDVHKGNKSVNAGVKCLVACTAYSDTFRTVIITSVHTAGEFYTCGQLYLKDVCKGLERNPVPRLLPT